MGAREQLHRMINGLPDPELQVALRFVEYLRDAPHGDALTQLLMTAPEDPESLTPGEASAVDLAFQQARTGQTIPWEEVRSQIG